MKILYLIVVICIIGFVITMLDKNQIQVCEIGEKRCGDSNSSEVCNNGYGWNIIDICDYGCSNGICKLQNQVCVPGERVCLASGDLGKCDSIGSAYYTEKECTMFPSGVCENLECKYPSFCSLGEKKCVNSTVYSCEEDSFGLEYPNRWIEIEHCLSECENGVCIYNSTYPIENGSYNEARINAGISDNYLKETYDYDYTEIYKNPKVIVLREKIKSMSAEQATKEIAKFTYNNINYDINTIPEYFCEDKKASEILDAGRGVCSTMSKVDIALLRGMGIASRPVSGCVRNAGYCTPYEISKYEGVPIFRVTRDEKAVFAGGYHSWVEVWLPNYGWTILESTIGRLHSTGCVEYDKYADQDTYDNTIGACFMNIIPYGEKCDKF